MPDVLMWKTSTCGLINVFVLSYVTMSPCCNVTTSRQHSVTMSRLTGHTQLSTDCPAVQHNEVVEERISNLNTTLPACVSDFVSFRARLVQNGTNLRLFNIGKPKQTENRIIQPIQRQLLKCLQR